MEFNQTYDNFLESKRIKLSPVGFCIDINTINSLLFDFQKDIVKWAVRKGRCAIFLDTGLGKTFCQLEWARLVGGMCLVVAPLSVARQTIREGKKIDIEINFAHDKKQLKEGINITNYELLDNFNSDLNSIVLDESSILKSIGGKIKKKLIDKFQDVKYKLCCTATPAPNDYIELGNHAQFLGISTHQEMLSMFFINANKEHTFIVDDKIFTKKGSNKGGTEWRIKHHAEKKFFEWLAAWAIFMMKPSDLGYNDEDFNLPELKIIPSFIKVNNYQPTDKLFFTGLSGIQDRVNVRKDMVEIKGEQLKSLISGSNDQWIIWCGLDKESSFVKNNLNGTSHQEVKGSDPVEFKISAFEDFQDGKFQVLITKPKIGAYGMNFQNANNMVFFGMNDSWETYYQAIRREWRFGQKKPVNVYLLLSSLEREIYENVMRKEKGAYRLRTEMISLIKNLAKEELMELKHEPEQYTEETIETTAYKAMKGDCVERLKEISNDSVDLSVYSPPFADLFVYSNSERDLGNSKGWDEFFKHYNFVIQEILRVTKQGRLTCVHTSDIPAMANRDGYIGLRDFPGEVIKAHEKNGWVFVGRCFIQKNPQAQAIRTKCKSLLFVQMEKDSTHSRPALIDQVLLFKKPGENQTPISPIKNKELDNEGWISWAHGIWTDINETDTLQYYSARERGDEKHICPLQLGTIERCIKLYSNPNELVLTPFMGIGSEAFMALKLRRRAIGIELKKGYFDVAINNLNSVTRGLFD
jgi:DNA modification methylase